MPLPKFAVSGHATLDYVVGLEQPFTGHTTAPAQFGAAGGWPRPGGATWYTSARLADAGLSVAPIAWLGEDKDAQAFVAACQERGFSIAGIDRDAGRRTVRCLMVYQPDGTTGCMIDDGGAGGSKLSPAQAAQIADADHVVISAGPAHATHEVLRSCRADASVSWIVKDDPLCFPADLAAEVARRSQLIFCNVAEMALVRHALGPEGRGSRAIVETQGSAGIRIHAPEGSSIVDVVKAEIDDATGAGDTLAGETIARMATETIPLNRAVSAATTRVREWLASR
ncbi:carbohydrate kinase family protein [Novosphingobium aquimarinum]|uniref:carbohydrate kinase family protein n=1 Tax=Novosphingobium aquimarinum TaxID=2682494 RepID=UPI0012ECB3FC|nr:carbohydrate kinase family protein [Novosphingobium aquimarinum]